MSVAVIMRGRKRSDINASLRAHQIRENEKDAKKILKDTASQIDPKLSHMNKNYFDDPDRLQEMRDKIDTISKKRQDAGGKKVYKSANVFMVGTLQIGDDSLEALGWKSGKDGKKLPADQQDERTLENVEKVYDAMVRSVKSQPEIYGDVFSATLHMDEGSPHVDFMSDPLDVNEPDRLARHFLNGEKGTPRGRNLAVMQDNLMKNSRLTEKTIETFGLVRGDGTSKRLNTARELRSEGKRLSVQEKNFETQVFETHAQIAKFKEVSKDTQEKQARKDKELKRRERLVGVAENNVKEDKKALEGSKNDFEAYVTEKEEEFEDEGKKQARIGQNLDDRELLVDKRENTVKKEEDGLKALKSDLEDREEKVGLKEDNASKKLLEAMRLIEIAEKLVETYEKVSEKIKKGFIRPEELIEAEEKTKRELNPYDAGNPEHLETMDEAISSLKGFSDDDLKDLVEDDSKQL